MRTFAHFGAKNFGFLKFLVCLHGQGDKASADNFWRKGRGSNFLDFLQTFFMDGSLCKQIMP